MPALEEPQFRVHRAHSPLEVPLGQSFRLFNTQASSLSTRVMKSSLPRGLPVRSRRRKSLREKEECPLFRCSDKLLRQHESMPRTPRAAVDELCHHVLTRGNAGQEDVHQIDEYRSFMRLIEGAWSRRTAGIPDDRRPHCVREPNSRSGLADGEE